MIMVALIGWVNHTQKVRKKLIDEKFGKKLLKEHEDRVEKFETHLKEILTKELDEENRSNITDIIRLLCMSMIQKEYYTLIVQSNIIEGMKYLTGCGNSKKAEKEVREKFHVPDSIPLVYK